MHRYIRLTGGLSVVIGLGQVSRLQLVVGDEEVAVEKHLQIGKCFTQVSHLARQCHALGDHAGPHERHVAVVQRGGQ